MVVKTMTNRDKKRELCMCGVEFKGGTTPLIHLFCGLYTEANCMQRNSNCLVFCKHKLLDNESVCRSCHIKSVPLWMMATQHFMTTSIRHVYDPTYLQFLNIMQERQPVEEGNYTMSSLYFIEGHMLQQHVDHNTTILCFHWQDVTKYIIFEKKFKPTQKKHVVIKNVIILKILQWVLW